MKKHAFLAVLLCALGSLPILTQAADEKSSDTNAKPAAVKPAGRLPAHFGKFVDKPQREKIYSIQAKYADKIEDLQEQLKDVMLQRDKEIREVLTSEQQKQLDELLATVRAKMKSAKKSADVDKTDESAKN